MQLQFLLQKPPFLRDSSKLSAVRQDEVAQPFHAAFYASLATINAVDPLQLWIIQLVIIVGTASLLSHILREIRQPQVIAEVLGGIVLGPTVCGRIPGFTDTIFPPESRPYIKLTADIGLCLFFFLIGLEIDMSVVKNNLRASAVIALAGMIFPFIIGAGSSVVLYNRFMNDTIQFTYFAFFAGVAFSVTAFPVLCRILIESKLLDTTVGVAVLSAGVGNDVVGWIMLALSVAFLKAGSAVTAMCMLLGSITWVLVLCFPIRHCLRRLARTSRSIERGPSISFMTIVILVLFSSVLISDIHGVHAIFGAFVAGVIVPREGNLAIELTEKLEDMVAIIFLPLYFALLGMSTDLWLLDDGITWAYTAAIVIVAFASKFGSCALAARYAAGFSWRESGAIGSLMSCKGLVELIVLDVGLSAGILTPRVFTMFVLKALVLTFMTTPLVNYLYPSHSRRRTSIAEVTPFDVQENEGQSITDSSKTTSVAFEQRFTIILEKLEHLPAAMAFSHLIIPQVVPEKYYLSSSSTLVNAALTLSAPISIQALRLIELSDRPSAVMKSSINDSLLSTDPILAVFRKFCELSGLVITPAIDIATHDDLPLSVVKHARNHGSDILLLPWLLHPTNVAEAYTASIEPDSEPVSKPHTSMVRELQEELTDPPRVFQNVMKTSEIDVAIFVARNIDSAAWGTNAKHIFFPFFGGPDDRRALEFVAQLCENNNVSATVLRIVKTRGESPPSKAPLIRHPQLEDADDRVWESFISSPSRARIIFKHIVTAFPLHDSIHEAECCKQLGSQLLIVVGRGHTVDYDRESEDMEGYAGGSKQLRWTIGDAATAFTITGWSDGIIIFQARGAEGY